VPARIDPPMAVKDDEMKNFKVLLVDDEQEFIETLSERLKMRDSTPSWRWMASRLSKRFATTSRT